MAWPKLRNKSSGPLMMEGNRSGAAHDGARSQGKEAEGAPEGPARLPFLRAQGARRPEAAAGAGGSGPVRDAPVRDTPVSWPGQAVDERRPPRETAADGGRGGGDGPGARGGRTRNRPTCRCGTGPRPRAFGAEPSAEEPPGDRRARPRALRRARGPAEARVEAGSQAYWWRRRGGRRPGIGQRRGSLAQLAANPRMRIWQLRPCVAVVILGVFWYLCPGSWG
jgi:hypothetical protein